MVKKVGLLYLVLLHLAFGVTACRHLLPTNKHPDEITNYYKRILKYHVRQVGSLPSGTTIVVGDSFAQSFPACSLFDKPVNFGIGSDTTKGVLERLNQYQPALNSAQTLILMVGLNDKDHRSPAEAVKNYEYILQQIPDSVEVLCVVILPPTIKNKDWLPWIRDFNQLLRDLVQDFEQATLIEHLGELDRDNDKFLDDEYSDDGVHLNSSGTQVWVESFQKQLKFDAPE